MPSPIAALSYLRTESQDLDAWAALAADVLGMEVSRPAGGRLVVRLDDRVGRIIVTEGPSPGLAGIGWEAPNRRALDEAASAVAAAGIAVRELSDEEAADRLVSAGVAFDDPAGLPVEITFGAHLDPIRTFTSPIGARFVTGDQGLGHVTALTGRFEETVELYTQVLGFEVRETVSAEFDIAFLSCNPRQHALALARDPRGGDGVHFDHLMVEVDDIDHVGRALDKVLRGAAPLTQTLGRHWNDEMISFYVMTPDGFQLEYGYGGKRIDGGSTVELTQRTPGGGSRWGHRRLEVGPA